MHTKIWYSKGKRPILLMFLLLGPITSYASFIESSIGAAVVNDATATYYNPAALTLLKTPQVIGLGSFSSFNSDFNGQTTQLFTDFTQTGSATNKTNYDLPSAYLAAPLIKNMSVGLAVVSNFFNNNLEDNSLLRYVQSSNRVQNMDLVPAIGVKINDYFSLGAGLNFSHASFLMQPTLGFPTLNIPDTQSRNASNANGVGYAMGLLFRPRETTMVGFDYRSQVKYRFSGNSVFNSQPPVYSNDYHFAFWTPARSVLSVSQALTEKLGIIGTIQYIQWNVLHTIYINGIAVKIGTQPAIVNSIIPFHLHNSWVATIGDQYKLNTNWVIRFAGSFAPSPGNNHYQITQGNNIIIGTSVGYRINKYFSVDGSYAHAFMQDRNIYISTPRNNIVGVSSGFRNAVSIKLTVNM